MNKLYFIKLERQTLHRDQIVCLQTANNEEQAKAKAWEFISPPYRSLYDLKECTFICNTPDEVINFEPV